MLSTTPEERPPPGKGGSTGAQGTACGERGPSSPAASCNTHGRCLSLLVLEKWFLRKQCCFNQRHIHFKHATQTQHFPKRIPSTRVALLGPGGHHCLLLTPPAARRQGPGGQCGPSPASHLHSSKQRTSRAGFFPPWFRPSDMAALGSRVGHTQRAATAGTAPSHSACPPRNQASP